MRYTSLVYSHIVTYHPIDIPSYISPWCDFEVCHIYLHKVTSILGTTTYMQYLVAVATYTVT